MKNAAACPLFDDGSIHFQTNNTILVENTQIALGTISPRLGGKKCNSKNYCYHRE